jgi:hypothetical protein
MPARCYSRAEVIELLHLKPRTFDRLKAKGALPFVEEVKPSMGPKHKLYRADLLDRYLAGEWGTSRYLSKHKKGAAREAAAAV